MKERRGAGATHSFRLTPKAASIVDEIIYPRRLGGKSKRVSQAIEWFWTCPTMGPKDGTTFISVPTAYELHLENEELKENIAALQLVITDYGTKNRELTASPPASRGWFRRIFGRRA